MNESEETKKDPVQNLVQSIQDMSDKRIELALKNRGIENLDNVLDEAKKEMVEEARRENKKDIDSLKKDFFIIFGIFASFITFVVGEISILKGIEGMYDKIGFSFLFVSFILGFLFGIMFLLDADVIKDKYIKMSWVFTLFFIFGLGFIVVPDLVQYF